MTPAELAALAPPGLINGLPLTDHAIIALRWYADMRAAWPAIERAVREYEPASRTCDDLVARLRAKTRIVKKWLGGDDFEDYVIYPECAEAADALEKAAGIEVEFDAACKVLSRYMASQPNGAIRLCDAIEQMAKDAERMRELLADYVDVRDDYRNNPPESRCYTSDAMKEVNADIDAAIDSAKREV